MRTAALVLLAAGMFGELPSASGSKQGAGNSPQRESEQPEPGTPKTGSKKLWAAIAVNRPVYDPDVISHVRLQMHFALVNEGDQTVETGADESQLIVNGKAMDSREWLTANHARVGVGRIRPPGSASPFDLLQSASPGLRGHGWERLSPGEHTAGVLPLERIITKPGVYRVSWRGKGFESPEIVFRVLPRKDQPVRGANPANTTALVPPIPGTEAQPAPGTIWAAVGLNRLVLDPDATPQERFLMTFGLVYDGDQIVNPGFYDSYLIVNGQPLWDEHRRWTLTQDGGLFSGSMMRLPPGQAVGTLRQMDKYFKAPGIYRVSWKSTSFESPEVVFRVLPRKP
jgi:hypothetical protein